MLETYRKIPRKLLCLNKRLLPSVARFQISEIEKGQVPILQISRPIKEGRTTYATSDARPSTTYVPVTSIFDSSCHVTHFLTFQINGNFLEPAASQDLWWGRT